MSAVSTAPHSVTPPTPMLTPAPARPDPVAFSYRQSDSFAPLLKQLGVSLLVTTYQANKLLVLREHFGGVSILGGRGQFLGVVGGALLFTGIGTILAGTTVPQSYRSVIIGLVLLGAVALIQRERVGS